jgi:hypothetical protein
MLSLASDDEGGGFAMFAPPICRRSWRNDAFPFRELRRRRRPPSEHRSERSEQSNRARSAASGASNMYNSKAQASKEVEGIGPQGPRSR